MLSYEYSWKAIGKFCHWLQPLKSLELKILFSICLQVYSLWTVSIRLCADVLFQVGAEGVHRICCKLLDLTSAIHSLTFVLNFHGKMMPASLTHPSLSLVSIARYYRGLMLNLCWLFFMGSSMQLRNFHNRWTMIWAYTNGVWIMTDKSSVIVSCMTEKYLMEASVLLSCDDGA